MDKGDTAWMLVATALVLFMTPGLAFFYGGMVRSKNVLGMLMQNFFAMGLIAVLWAVVYFGLHDVGATEALLGAPDGLQLELTIPFVLFAAYQMTFAVITPALISGATADRLKFSAYAIFIGLWLILVYAPIGHMVFGGGWIADMGALDFAGGAVVHMNAGAAALAVVLVLGKRRGGKWRAVGGARVQVAGRRGRTNRRGRARLSKTFVRGGRYRVLATKRGMRRATRWIRVLPPR